MIRHIGGWVILACILFSATAFYAASVIQILILTLSGQFGHLPASQTPAGDVLTSTPIPPQIFFSYLILLSGLVAVDLATVQVMRGKLHNSRLGIDRASTESSPVR